MHACGWRATLALWIVLTVPEFVAAQRAPAPDPAALATASEMRRSGSSAETVGREVRANFRQSGPQMVRILVEVGFREPEVARAVAAETRSDVRTAAGWLAEGAIPVASAYPILHEMTRSSPAAVRSLVEVGYPLREAVGTRQLLHPVDSRTHAVELKASVATPDEVGGIFNSLLGASARDAARDLLHAGYSVLDVAVALRDGYGLSAAQVAVVLADENVDAPEVLQALLDPAYGAAPLDAVKAFEGIGGTAQHAAVLLRDGGETPGTVTPLLVQAGYDPVAAGEAIRDAFGLPPVLVAAALSDAGVALAPVTLWLAGSGTPPEEGVAILRSLGAGAPVVAGAMLGSGWIAPALVQPWAGWAIDAGYDCGPVAHALVGPFQASLEVATLSLVLGGCGDEEVALAIDAAFGAPITATAAALAAAGLTAQRVAGALLAAGHTAADVGQALVGGLNLAAAQAQAAVAVAVLAAGKGVNEALSTSAEAVEASLETTVTVVITFLAAQVGLGDLFAWIRLEGAGSDDAAAWAADAGVGATAVAVALQDGFQASAVTVGNALLEAGYGAVAVVTALKEGLGLTYDQMVGISGSMMMDMMLMMQAIQQVYP